MDTLHIYYKPGLDASCAAAQVWYHFNKNNYTIFLHNSEKDFKIDVKKECEYYFIDCIPDESVVKNLINTSKCSYSLQVNESIIDIIENFALTEQELKAENFITIHNNSGSIADSKLNLNYQHSLAVLAYDVFNRHDPQLFKPVGLIADYLYSKSTSDIVKNFASGLSLFQTDIIQSNIGDISRTEIRPLKPPYNIWDYLFSSNYNYMYIEEISFYGRGFRYSALKNVDPQYSTIGKLKILNDVYTAIILTGDLIIFDNFTDIFDPQRHDCMIIYNYNSTYRLYDVYIKSTKALNTTYLEKLFNIKKETDKDYDYHIQLSDINYLLDIDYTAFYKSTSYFCNLILAGTTFNIHFIQCTESEFYYAYTLIFNQNNADYFGRYEWIEDLQQYKVTLRSTYVQDDYYEFEIAYNAKVSADKLEIIFYTGSILNLLPK